MATLKITSSNLEIINSFQTFNGSRKWVAVGSDFFRVDLNKDGTDEIILVSMDHSYSGNFANHEQLQNSYLHVYGLISNKWADVTNQYIANNEISGATNVCAGDFNGDGKVDLFIAAQTDTNVYPVSDLFLSSSSKYLHSTLNLQTWAHGSYVADVNQDGYQDVLITDYGTNQGILFGSATGLSFKKFADAFVAPSWKGPWGESGICAADFLGNGTQTILVSDDASTGANSTNLYSWAIDSSGNLNLTYISSLPTPLFETSKWSSYQFDGYKTGAASHDVRVLPFDFGNDALIDAIVISRPSFTNGVWPEFTEIQFLQNYGRGRFEDVTSTKLPNFDNKLGATPYAPVFDDFNGDGKIDIFLSGADNEGVYDSTALLIQRADGIFVECGKDVFNALWNQAIVIQKQYTNDYIYTSWGNTMSLTKGEDDSLHAFLCVNYASDGLDRTTVYSAKITIPSAVTGHAGVDVLHGDDGDDKIDPGGGDDSIDGGAGVDTVAFTGSYASHVVTHQSNGSYVVADKTSGRDGTDTLTDIERLEFTDYNVALDTDSANSAGGIYRLYQAAFDREPDLSGLGYWIDAADNGKSAVTMAEDFTWSKEFLDLFHLSTPKDNYFTGVEVKTLVEGMYTHVLHRAADAGGLNYYAGVIASHEKTVGRVLAEISDSPENHTAVANSIANGIQYTPYTSMPQTMHLDDELDAQPQSLSLNTLDVYGDPYQVDVVGQNYDLVHDWMWLC